ncbi:hypothetical protein DPMN_135241 [Dreissena polymorpha]|uniref:Uncharacterized protein n=1 Tax=Dreissena polymorpha TaxID=45954 RepID=A0A9D4G3J1_DREPO|nr:hypothetical protein DPMN_135241 [Dreissena polymorpha]
MSVATTTLINSVMEQKEQLSRRPDMALQVISVVATFADQPQKNFKSDTLVRILKSPCVKRSLRTCFTIIQKKKSHALLCNKIYVYSVKHYELNENHLLSTI